jgi:hypothetical protein
MLRALAFWLLGLLAAGPLQAAVPAAGGDVTASARYWVDTASHAAIEDVARLPEASFKPMAGAAPV